MSEHAPNKGICEACGKRGAEWKTVHVNARPKCSFVKVECCDNLDCSIKAVHNRQEIEKLKERLK